MAPTQSKALSIAESLYGPIGWLPPIVMKLRVNIQGLWQEGLDWHVKTPDPEQGQSAKIFSSLAYLNQGRADTARTLLN